MSYINAEVFINKATLMQSNGGSKEDNDLASGIKNIRQYDAENNKSVPYVGQFISLELIITGAYEWQGKERVTHSQGSMSGQKVYMDILLEGLDTKRRDDALRLILNATAENSHELPGPVYIKQDQLDAVLKSREYSGRTYYDVFRIAGHNTEKPFAAAASVSKVSTRSKDLFAKLLAAKPADATPELPTHNKPAEPAKPAAAKVDDEAF